MAPKTKFASELGSGGTRNRSFHFCTFSLVTQVMGTWGITLQTKHKLQRQPWMARIFAVHPLWWIPGRKAESFLRPFQGATFIKGTLFWGNQTIHIYGKFGIILEGFPFSLVCVGNMMSAGKALRWQTHSNEFESTQRRWAFGGMNIFVRRWEGLRRTGVYFRKIRVEISGHQDMGNFKQNWSCWVGH